MSKNQIKDDLLILDIDISQELTTNYVTAKFRKLARERHPDKDGGNTGAFQILNSAYRRIIRFLEEEHNEDEEKDYETEFFMRNNFMKECTGSYVVYIQDNFVDKWRQVLERHLGVHKFDNIRVIYKSGEITVTLYKKPKKDPRSKIHIQSKDKEKNLDFILESLSRFYNEVCAMSEVSPESVKYKELQRSLCAKCGKYFINKKGLKQHILRMHSSTTKRMKVDKVKPAPNIVGDKSIPVPCVTLEEEVVIGSVDNDDHTNITPVVEPVRIISGPKQALVIRSPAQKKKRTEEPNKEEDDNSFFIKSLLGELLDQCSEEIDTNYQCGECGKTFYEKDDSQAHMEIEHTVDTGCNGCVISEKEEKVLRDLNEDKDDLIKELLAKNNNLVKKNIALDKDTKRLTLAFNQSMIEKGDVRKELNITCEALNDALKQNTQLNDELKVKTELLNLLKDTGNMSKDNDNNEPNPNSENQKETDKDTNLVNEEDDRIKCNECDFKTRVRTYLKSHRMVHEGQYQCQRGCREKFKTWSILDEHHKSKHSAPTNQTEVFKCDVCKSSFLSKQNLRHHIEAKHANQDNSAKRNATCD